MYLPLIPDSEGSAVSSPLPFNTITKGVTTRTDDIFHAYFKHWPHLAQSTHPLLSCYQPPPWATGRRKNISILSAQKFLSTIMSTMGRVGSQDNSITFLTVVHKALQSLGASTVGKRAGWIRDFQMVLMESYKGLLKKGWQLPKGFECASPLPLIRASLSFYFIYMFSLF